MEMAVLPQHSDLLAHLHCLKKYTTNHQQ